MDLQDYINIAREEGIKKGREEQLVITEREKARADAEKSRADAAEAELTLLKERLTKLEKTSR